MIKIWLKLKYLLFNRPEFFFVMVMAVVALSLIFFKDSQTGVSPKREVLSTSVTSEKKPVDNRDSCEKSARMPETITRAPKVTGGGSEKSERVQAVTVKNPWPEALEEQPEPVSREELVEELVDRCLEETDATSVEIVDKGRMNFTVVRLTNRAVITMEELADRYFEMFPDEKQIAVSVLDDNGEVAGSRVYPRRFAGR